MDPRLSTNTQTSQVSQSDQPQLELIREIYFKEAKEILVKEELTDTQMSTFYHGLKDDHRLGILLVIAAANWRIKSLIYLFENKLGCSAEHLQRWIDGQSVAVTVNIPSFLSNFNWAIGDDNANYLDILTCFSPEIKCKIDSMFLTAHPDVLVECTNMIENFESAKSKVEAIKSEYERVKQFAHAVVSGNLDYIRQNLPNHFSPLLLSYFAILAVVNNHMELFKELTAQKNFSKDNFMLWAQQKYFFDESLDVYMLAGLPSIYDVLLSAVKRRDIAFITTLAPWLISKRQSRFSSKYNDICILSTDQQLSFVHQVIDQDDVELLELLVKTLKCEIGSHDHDWSLDCSHTKTWEEVVGDDSWGYGGHLETRTRRDILPAKDHYQYKSPFLAAADNQKIKSLRWIMVENTSFDSIDNNWADSGQ